MARLRNLKPRLSSLSPRIGYTPSDEKARDRHRAATQHWRSWYKTARWLKLRDQALLRDLYTCQMCKRMVHGKYEAHVDHIKPHRGDPALFYDFDNLQVLCASCHNGIKQAEEKSGKVRHPIGEDGWPVE